MLEFLKNHPFAVEAFFERSLVLGFAVPKEQLGRLIPECLQLDTYKDQWGFIAVALVQTKGLRPKGFPEFLGNNFFLIGYRVFVRYVNNNGKRLRGLYILKSETDKKLMEFTGNIFTNYSYSTTDITISKTSTHETITSIESKLKIAVDTSIEQNITLPINSPFPTWEEARKFAGPMPFTFTYHPSKNEVLIIEGVRQNWTPKPVKVLQYDISFLNNLKLNNVILANAFAVENIPYYWKKGRLEKWTK